MGMGKLAGAPGPGCTVRRAHGASSMDPSVAVQVQPPRACVQLSPLRLAARAPLPAFGSP